MTDSMNVDALDLGELCEELWESGFRRSGLPQSLKTAIDDLVYAAAICEMEYRYGDDIKERDHATLELCRARLALGAAIVDYKRFLTTTGAMLSKAEQRFYKEQYGD